MSKVFGRKTIVTEKVAIVFLFIQFFFCIFAQKSTIDMDILTIVKDINNQTKEFKGGFKDKISHLNNPLYNKIFQSVNILEKDNLVLFRYASYSDIMDGEINQVILGFNLIVFLLRMC